MIYIAFHATPLNLRCSYALGLAEPTSVDLNEPNSFFQKRYQIFTPEKQEEGQAAPSNSRANIIPLVAFAISGVQFAMAVLVAAMCICRCRRRKIPKAGIDSKAHDGAFVAAAQPVVVCS